MSSLLNSQSSPYTSSNFILDVAKGNVVGHSIVNITGFSGLITTETDPQDIWQHSAIVPTYTYTANAGATYYISSANNTDTQSFLFYVLTADNKGNWNQETIIQNAAGQTKTALITPSGNPIVRIIRALNYGTTGLAGILYVYEDCAVVAGVPQTNSCIREVVYPNFNQSQRVMYTIPSGYVAFQIDGQVGIKFSGSLGTGNNFATMTYYTRSFNKIFLSKKSFSFATMGTTYVIDKLTAPFVIPAKTDLKGVVDEVSADISASAFMQFMLVDESFLRPDFLTSIGQIKKVS